MNFLTKGFLLFSLASPLALQAAEASAPAAEPAIQSLAASLTEAFKGLVKEDEVRLSQLQQEYLAALMAADALCSAARSAAVHATISSIEGPQSELSLAGALEASSQGDFNDAAFALVERTQEYAYPLLEVDAWSEAEAVGLAAAQAQLALLTKESAAARGSAAYKAAEKAVMAYTLAHGADFFQKRFKEALDLVAVHGISPDVTLMISLGILWHEEDWSNSFLVPYMTFIDYARDRVPLWLT